jgi:HD superfamily phosphohydrolase
MIVGAMLPYRSNDNVRRYYLTQIINGQYDADKLDYLRRDSYTAGLALTYDIDRFLYKIKIEDRDESGEDDKIIRGKHLVIPVTGITAVEEMAFSQLMLASYIYQHQKVLAADALMSDIVRAFKEHKKLSHPCDFLYYCDSDILGTSKESTNGDFKTKPFDSNSGSTIADIVQKIKNRDLPKRAFIINTSTVKPDKQGRDPKPYPASDIAERLSKIEGLRNEIVKMSREIANNDCLPDDIMCDKHVDYYDVHISIPNTCIAKDLSNALVLKNNKEFVRLSDIVRLSDWADAFAWHKWHAYVFAKEAILPIVSIASKIVFEKHGIIFNDDAVVFAGIKCSDKIIELIKKLKDNNKYPL